MDVACRGCGAHRDRRLSYWLNTSTADVATPRGDATSPETGAIKVGTGPDTVSVWFDFYYSHCHAFEEAYGTALADLVNEGSVSLQSHPIVLRNSTPLPVPISPNEQRTPPTALRRPTPTSPSASHKRPLTENRPTQASVTASSRRSRRTSVRPTPAAASTRIVFGTTPFPRHRNSQRIHKQVKSGHPPWSSTACTFSSRETPRKTSRPTSRTERTCAPPLRGTFCPYPYHLASEEAPQRETDPVD